MGKYISKAAVVAEIEKKLQDLITCKENTSFTEQRVVLWAKIDMCNEIFSILDTLEVKEVDLDREIRRYRMRNPIIQHKEESLYDYMTNVAKHFFELGIKTQKGE